jgi:hypothetical protein
MAVWMTQFLVQLLATTAYSPGDRRFDIVDAVDLGGPLVTPVALI